LLRFCPGLFEMDFIHNVENAWSLTSFLPDDFDSSSPQHVVLAVIECLKIKVC
jgi:hypothetical protein